MLAELTLENLDQVCTRCVDPNAGTCDSSGATSWCVFWIHFVNPTADRNAYSSSEKLNLFAGACGTCPDGTHSKRQFFLPFFLAPMMLIFITIGHVCVPCKEADAKTCSSSVATSW